MQMQSHINTFHMNCGLQHNVWVSKIRSYLYLPLNSPFVLCVLASLSYRDMESAIQTVVTTFIGSSRGKENLDSKSFKKLIQKQLGSIMEVRTHVWLFVVICHTNSTKINIYQNQKRFNAAEGEEKMYMHTCEAARRRTNREVRVEKKSLIQIFGKTGAHKEKTCILGKGTFWIPGVSFCSLIYQ